MAIAAQPIIDELKKQANSILASILHAPLEGFDVGSLGNFPYYWENPSNLMFNTKTYNWISANLKDVGTDTVALDSPFVNTYIEVFAKLSYSLSTNDQASLVTAQKNATNQQMALLTAWKAAYNSIPTATATQQPIDIIMHTIASQWATPATDLNTIKLSKNLNALLNNTPASGQPILNPLANYLNALGSSISLQNNSTMNNGYLQTALQAVQSPSNTNGALQTDNNVYQPAYQISTQLSDIINALANQGSAISLKMVITNVSSSQCTVSINGGTGFNIPFLDFFSFSLGSQVNYFSDSIAMNSSSLEIDMEFTGVNLVNFGPVPFYLPTNQSWYWINPIQEAIKNGNNDVSGFKFSPTPQVNFGQGGPFSFPEGVAICNQPAITITAKTANYSRIETDLKTTTSFGISFLGIPLGGGSSTTYQQNVQTNSSNSTVVITLSPPKATVGGSSVDDSAWVLGVQTSYPAA